MDNDDIYYQEKYLKYKKKYLELKKLEQEGGLFTFKSGNYTYFGPQDVFIKAGIPINDSSINGKDAPSVSDLNSKFNNKGVYRIKTGDIELELVRSSGLQRIGKSTGAVAGLGVLYLSKWPMVLAGKTLDRMTKTSQPMRNIAQSQRKSYEELNDDVYKEAKKDLNTAVKGGVVEKVVLDTPYDGNNIDEILSKLNLLYIARQSNSQPNSQSNEQQIDTALTINIGKGFAKNKYADVKVISTPSDSTIDYV